MGHLVSICQAIKYGGLTESNFSCLVLITMKTKIVLDYLVEKLLVVENKNLQGKTNLKIEKFIVDAWSGMKIAPITEHVVFATFWSNMFCKLNIKL